MLLRENKSLASAILDLGEQIQIMGQILRDFCQNYGRINNPQSEVEIRIDEFLTDARNVFNGCCAETVQSTAPSPGAHPATDSLSSSSSLPSSLSLSISAESPLNAANPPLLNPPIPLLHRPSILPVPLPSAGFIQPPTYPLPPPPASPTFAVLGSREDHPQSVLAVQNEGADFTVVDRKTKRKVSTDRNESKAQRGTGVTIDCRWASPVIAKL